MAVASPLESPTPGATSVVVAQPHLLDPQDLVSDGEGWKYPFPPKKDPAGNRIHLDNDTDHSPRGEGLEKLSLPESLTEIRGFNQSDPSGKRLWRKIQNLDYCHFHEGGRDWYGWRTGDTFQWVLFKSGRFWWHDAYAERWLSFYNSYWWWQGRKKDQQVQVYMDNGHYYLCGADGTLGDDLWTTGVVQAATKPVDKDVTASSTPGRDNNGFRHGGIGGSQMGGN